MRIDSRGEKQLSPFTGEASHASSVILRSSPRLNTGSLPNAVSIGPLQR